MNLAKLVPALGVMACTNAAFGASVTLLGQAFPTDVSPDGSVVAGNLAGSYETFRWTDATGIVPLGMSSVAVLGVGAGTPDVSADGTRISATILGVDSTYVTQGLWTEGAGWLETMPPVPPEGSPLDNQYGSSWGLSDDGQVIVGLLWRLGLPGGTAHACKWTASTGVVDLGSNGGSSRANDTNADGSVIVGWTERFDGTWQPTVWTPSGMTILTPTLGFCEAEAVTPDGTTIIGSTYEEHSFRFFAARWDWNGSTWVEQVLGDLPGTAPNTGYVTGNDITADGTFIVGFNQFFFGNSAGFVWTEETGVVDAEDFFDAEGIMLPSTLEITALTGVSDDGLVITGVAQRTTPPFASEGFVVHRDSPVDAPVLASGTMALRVWPNPTRGATNVAFVRGAAGPTRVSVYDAAGRLVRQVAEGESPRGEARVVWDGRDRNGGKVAPGVYYLRVEGDRARESRKLVVVH
jgi:uncharacterized membrane protein